MELIDHAVAHFQEREAIELTRSLIRIPSISGTEKAIGEYLYGEFERMKLPVEIIEATKGRPNVVARLKGKGDEVGLILVGHMDTVPPDQGSNQGWNFDPFQGDFRNGRIYGLGSGDMKGGIAAILIAVKSVLQSGMKLGKGLTVAFCSDEEPGSAEGMKYIAEKKLIHGNLAMAADTTNGCIQGWFKGRTIYEIVTQGKSAHPSNPTKGVNAVHHMADLVYKINHQGFAHQKHKFLGKCTLNFGFIQGGKDVKSIPEECKALLEVRMVPGQTVEGVRKQIETYIQELKKADPRVDATVRVLIGKEPLEIPVEDPIFDRIQSASRRAIGRELEWSRAGIGGGDLYFLWKSMGIQCINFGPGDVELAHSPNEYVTLDHLLAVSKCYTAFIVQFCEGYLE